MGREEKRRTFAADFETTVYSMQKDTRVWLTASCELFADDSECFVGHSIGEQWEHFLSYGESLVVYYHNLKFDGSFWLWYLLNDLGYTQHFVTDDTGHLHKGERKKMEPRSLYYIISDTGQWYSIVVNYDGSHTIEFRDSLKLLPFSLRSIGKSFGTRHQKLEMEYEGRRYPGCPVTEQEMEYMRNDVYVLKEALEYMKQKDQLGTTIGAVCLKNFKRTQPKRTYDDFFPNLYEMCFRFPEEEGGCLSVGDYIRQAYKGGWCYLVPEKAQKVFRDGTTADVNSLYPSMMHSMSGNRYPIGMPEFWRGDIPDVALEEGKTYFVRFRCRFHVKDGFLPFVQIKGTLGYRGTECLKTSDVYWRRYDKYVSEWIDSDGRVHKIRPTLTMTKPDFELFLEHYDVEDLEILDGCYFATSIGLFDEYIDYYAREKKTSTGARRSLAKLMLNNLYGQFAKSTESTFKTARVTPEGLEFDVHEEWQKEPGYIPIGAMITSYARCFTIRAAQANYHGPDKPGFIYADTDSIHCDLPPEEIKGIRVHKRDFCAWKLETGWDRGWFVRQKTYIEHVTAEDTVSIAEPYYNVKCAGMPDRCKNLFLESVEGTAKDPRAYKPLEREFVYAEDGTPIRREITDFKPGLKIWGKLVPKEIPGGMLLVDTEYEIRG